MSDTLYFRDDADYPLVAPVVCQIYQGLTQQGADIAATAVAGGYTATVPGTLAANTQANDEGYNVVWVDNDGLTIPADGLFYWDGTDIVDPLARLAMMIQDGPSDFQFDAEALEQGEDDFDVN